MPTHDTNSREYLKFADAKSGLEIELDGGFTCSPAKKTTLQGNENDLWFPCSCGKHHLNGQIEGDYVIGVYPI